MQKIFHSTNYSQEQLNHLSFSVCTKLDDLLDHFRVRESCRKANKFYVGPCPVHGGDKFNAFNLFHSGEIVGNWKCHTHGCHRHFHPTIIGFTRGLLSHQQLGWHSPENNEKEFSFHRTVEFLINFTKSNIKDIKPDYEAQEKNRFTKQMESIYSFSNKEEYNLSLDPNLVLSSLEIPAKYFVFRGYSEAILKKYNVGLCSNRQREMYMRAVAPIYNNDYTKIIGCTGRSIFDKCGLCNSFHNPVHKCPSREEKWLYAKWRHNKGFPSQRVLYNYWFSAEHIKKDKVAIIVESPGNVWRLEEAGIPYSVGIFGSKLSDHHKLMLDNSGALSLIVLTDPDKAGILCRDDIIEQCGRSYQIHTPNLGGNDIGDTSVQLLKEKLVPFIEQIKDSYK